MNTEKRDLLEKTLNFAKAKGAECDIILSAGESFSAGAQNGEIATYKLSGSQIIGIRTIKDQKVGISYSESFDEDALSEMVNKALDTGRFTDVNEHEEILKTKSETIIDKELPENTLSVEEKLNFCLSLESDVKERDSRVQAVPYSGYGEGSSESYYLSSSGTFTYERDFSLSCYSSALISDGQTSSMHYHSAIERDFNLLDKESCIRESLEHASNWLGAEAISTGQYDVIFNMDSFDSLLGCFSSMFNARSAWEKTNPFAERLGEQIATSALTITDVPAYENAFYQHHFDSEGVKHKNLALIEAGVLKNFYHNSSTASYFKTETTGHAVRGAKGSLNVSGTNILVKEGSEESPLNGEYLEICSMQGLHSGANSISGDFSFGASGYLCRDGKRVRPVKGITVAGNFYKMLNEIECIGDKLFSNTSRSVFAPIVRFRKLSVGGK